MESTTTPSKSEIPTVKWNPISITIFIVMVGLTGWLFYLEYLPVPAVIAISIASIFIARSIHIANQWEKAVVLRMGKFIGLKGPGIFMIVPILDKIDKFVDQRVRVTDFKADQTLTKDTVPVNVDAVVYWTVWDVEKAALEVQEYETAISYIAQTALRDMIGKNELAELLHLHSLGHIHSEVQVGSG